MAVGIYQMHMFHWGNQTIPIFIDPEPKPNNLELNWFLEGIKRLCGVVYKTWRIPTWDVSVCFDEDVAEAAGERQH
jgi:hypothetical protein